MTVALVLVSHVAEIAHGVRRLAAQMAPDVPIAVAGGDDEGGVGTSFDRVMAALDETADAGATLLLYDLGSALLTAETAVEMRDDAQRVRIVDAPLVEGTLAAATAAQQGADLDEVSRAALGAGAGAGTGAGADAGAADPGPDAVHDEVVLANPLGLHARPAADLARLLADMDARVLLAGTGSEWVDASSVVAVIGLGLRGGDVVRVAADGPAAADAVRRTAALVESGFGEGEPEAGEAAALTGVAAAPGVAEGPAFLVESTFDTGDGGGTIDVEAQRLAGAIDTARTQLESADTVFRPIAGAQRALLDDPMLRGRASALVDRGRPADQAWATAVEEAYTLLAGVPDAAMADRAADVRDVGGRVAAALAGRDFDAGVPEGAGVVGAVLVADEVLPSQVVRAHARGMAGLVGARGGGTAHAAQLARELGLPAVFGAGDEVRAIARGRRVCVDGRHGRVELR